MDAAPVTLSSQPVELADARDFTRFGLVVLATDQTSERDLAIQLPAADTAVHTTRIAYENPTTPENLRAMAPRLAGAGELLAPVGPLRAVCFSCTSASVLIGDDAVGAALSAALPGVPVITPARAARLALTALGVERLAILTPYTRTTSTSMADYFAGFGFGIDRFDCLGLEDDREMGRVSRDTIVAAALAADCPAADALFISCTALPALHTICEIEKAIDKPVVTSNQASAWAMARTAGFADHKPVRFGRLYAHELPDQPTGEAA